MATSLRGFAFVQALVLISATTVGAAEATKACRIQLVDQENGWPVPSVELKTTHHVRLLSDNAGVIAFDLPELIGRSTWLTVEGEGYTVDADGFGFHGVRIEPEQGGRQTVKLKRRFPGKRLGRLTGAGLFAESQKLGEYADWEESGVLGCDSIQLVLLGDRILWTWGDTTVAGYPLGLFHMTGATTSRKPLSRFEPPIEPAFEYFRDSEHSVRVVAQMPGEGPTWLGGYAMVRDVQGRDHLMATYEKIKPPLSVYEVGFCEWHDEIGAFRHHSTIWKQIDGPEKPPAFPTGHVVQWSDPDEQPWLLCGHGVPDLKIPASYESLVDPKQWLTLPSQSLIKTATGEKIQAHRGSIAWNDALDKWVFAFTQLDGKTSFLGEVWLAISDSPLGPFQDAIQVATHDKYTFYNVMQHPELTTETPKVLLFEGTYTNTFSGNESFKPRHDYNQMLYRVDLDDQAFAPWRNDR